MIDLTTYIHSNGLRVPLSQCSQLQLILDNEIDYLADLSLDGLKDEPVIEMED